MKKKPIFITILIPVMLLMALEILILIGTINRQGIFKELDTKEETLVDERVLRSKVFLETRMDNDWMNLGNTVEHINSCTRRFLETGEISWDTLDNSSSDCEPLLTEVAEELMSMLRTSRATGAFLILNTEQEIPQEACEKKPGIYIRDEDPLAMISGTNQDILLERGPAYIVRTLGISADSSWMPQIEPREDTGAYYDFLRIPYEAALSYGQEYEWSDLGYWSHPYQLTGEGKTLISYSVPLCLEDGTLYGVLGIDVTEDYIRDLLPDDELSSSGLGAYFLAGDAESNGKYPYAFGAASWFGTLEDGGIVLDESYYYHEETLNIYASNTPFSEDKWVLVGAVPNEQLKSFSMRMSKRLGAAIFLALVIGILGCFFTSYYLQKPLADLSSQMRTQEPGTPPVFKPTGILEIDQMTDAIEHLSNDVLESSTKLTKIIEMASVRLAGFQRNQKEKKLFLTDHFFDIFLMDDAQEQVLDIEEFDRKMRSLEPYIVQRDDKVGNYVFKIQEGTSWRYIQLSLSQDDENLYGLAEDVTRGILEKEVLRHERDHDLLTNLYNRRAFQRKMREMLEKKQELGQGAFLMLDLDNLKYINDTYGHEYGDLYIRTAAGVFQVSLPEHAVYARISGDEFNVFIYGCRSQEELKGYIERLKEGISQLYIELPNGARHRIGMSGGVAWYPQDGRKLNELMKYADYAMYRAKRSHKGEIQEFDRKEYRGQNVLLQNKALLGELIEKEAVKYVFQPIVDAHTGDVYGYEALMRPDMPGFRNVGEILDAAQEEGKQAEIEWLTWFVGMRTFAEHLQAGRISPDTHLFVNTIPNQRLSEEQEAEFAEKYGKYMHLLVMELTEEEHLDQQAWDEKQRIIKGMGGRIALDDYGTGYNGEKMLLSISPDFIKVDIEIVRGIHRSTDKQAVVEYIVNFAHERGKYIIAEGVEEPEEAQTVIQLGVDYLQGYFLARPQEIPEGIPEEKKQMIQGLRAMIE